MNRKNDSSQQKQFQCKLDLLRDTLNIVNLYRKGYNFKQSSSFQPKLLQKSPVLESTFFSHFLGNISDIEVFCVQLPQVGEPTKLHWKLPDSRITVPRAGEIIGDKDSQLRRFFQRFLPSKCKCRFIIIFFLSIFPSLYILDKILKRLDGYGSCTDLTFSQFSEKNVLKIVFQSFLLRL